MPATLNGSIRIKMVDGFLRAVILACWVSVFAPNAVAQSIPDAGSVLRQIERQESVDAPRLPDVAPTPPASAPEVNAQVEQTIPVKGFRFIGNGSIDESVLQKVVAKYLGQNLTAAQLQNIADEIATIYQDRGLLASATLPRQDVSEGEITIQVTEAKFGGIVFDDSQSGVGLRVSSETVKKFVERGLALGQQLSLEALDRGLLLADDLPGVSVQGTLEAGENDGETNVRLKLTPRRWYSGDVTANNYGARSTGQNQALANLSFASPLRIGDQLQVLALYSSGSQYGRLSYSAPIGVSGLRLGANLSYMTYRNVLSDFAQAEPKGSSTVFGVTALYPLVRTRTRNVYLNAEFDQKYFNNQSRGADGEFVTTSDYRINVLYLSFNANQYDGWGGGGSTTGSLNLGIGNVGLSQSPSYVYDQSGYQTSGGYSRLRWSINRSQALTDKASLYVAASGQFASKNLDSSEKFFLGGPYGVRAYPSNEGSGSEGKMLNVELRYQVSEQINVAAFYDWGQITQNKRNLTGDEGNPLSALNSFNLSGYGLQVSLRSSIPGTMNLIWARRIGANPNPTATGADQDGSYNPNRFWLTASIPF
jgi:hemolysin activation/secretion protein